MKFCCSLAHPGDEDLSTRPECDLEMISVTTAGQAGGGPASSRDCDSESEVPPTGPSIGTEGIVSRSDSPDSGSFLWIMKQPIKV